MAIFIKGNTASEIWNKIAVQLIDGSAKAQSSRAGDTSELLKVFFELENPRERWVLTRNPGINPAFAIAEIVWILNGRKDSKFLNFWNRQLPKYAGTGELYHGAYGYRLRKHLGIDQLNKAYFALLNNPNTRQIVLQIWDSSIDLPNKDGSPISDDVPCNIVSMLKIRDGKLEWTQIMRSNDLMRGLPHNIIQFTTLQEIIAGWLNINVGTYHHLSDSMHVYHESLKEFSVDQEYKKKCNTDDLRVKKAESDKLFKQFDQKIESLLKGYIDEESIKKISIWDRAPKSYQNLLYVICAEVARRYKYDSLVNEIIRNCSNPVLIQAWDDWYQRFHD